MQKSRHSTRKLEGLRKLVEITDAKIIGLLVDRFRTTKQIQNLKIESGIPIEQKKREKLLLERYKTFAKKQNIDPGLIQKLYGLIFSYAKKAGIMNRSKKATWKLKLKKKRSR